MKIPGLLWHRILRLSVMLGRVKTVIKLQEKRKKKKETKKNYKNNQKTVNKWQ